MEAKTYPVTHSEAEWRKLLTPEQFGLLPGSYRWLVDETPPVKGPAVKGQLPVKTRPEDGIGATPSATGGRSTTKESGE